MKCGPRAAEVLKDVQTYYPRREGTDGWNIPKMRGAYLMAVDQIFRHGCGDGTDSQHGERMHQEFIGKIARNTQRRSSTFVEQLAQRRHDNFTIEKAVESNVGELMSLPGGGDGQREPTAHSDLNATPQCWSYYDHDIPLCGNTVRMEGAYTVEVSAAVGQLSSRNGDKSSRTFDIVWKYHARNIVRSTLEEKLLFPIAAQANKDGRWIDSFRFTGWTEIVKKDVTRGNHPTLYRAHPVYCGQPWFDWGLFHFAGQDDNTSCAGMILGFIRFETPGFPTPNLVEKWGNSVPEGATDHSVYVVARCSPDFQNFDEKFVTKVTLIPDEHGVYILPLKRLIGPLACVPNMSEFQDHPANWLSVLPYRKWGRYFGNSISWNQRSA